MSFRYEQNIRRAAIEAEIKSAQAGNGRQAEAVARVWKCPKCGWFKCKWTTLAKSSRYWSVDDRCNNPSPNTCKTPSGRGKRTRNILPHTVRVYPDRTSGMRAADIFNGRGE